MTDTAIKVENLSKRYRIGLEEEMHETFVGALTDTLARPIRNLRRLRRLTTFDDGNSQSAVSSEQSTVGGQQSAVGGPSSNDIHQAVDGDIIWALKDVSFEVERGEVVGIIGRNGAGKSTLLKILSRITEPTSGRVELNGRVSSLLEVGTGFHPELTGRENIYLNGAILGMTKAEIDRKFDEIVDFSGVEKFIDTPVKRYSSGMRVRLAFSVAAHLEPEILLVDEVLAVGDTAFQKKCLGKMQNVASEGRTVLLVSHNMGSILSLCEAAILLDHGSIVCAGDPSRVVQHYLEQSAEDHSLPLKSRKDRRGNGLVRLVKCKICTAPQGEPVSEFILGDKAYFVLTLEAQAQARIWIGLKIVDAFGQVVFSLNGRQRGFVPQVDEGMSEVILHIPSLPLLEGQYTLTFVCSTAGTNEPCDVIERVGSFTMHPGDIYGSGQPYTSDNGLVFVDYEWRGPTELNTAVDSTKTHKIIR